MILLSDRPLPDLPDGGDGPGGLLVLDHGEVALPEGATEVHRWPGDLGLALYRSPEGWTFLSREGLAFHVEPGGNRLRCPADPAAWEIAARQVLPRILHLRGRHVLHGSAVAAPTGALAILGPSGAGKSTLAAALLQHLGWPLLADDAIVLEVAGDRPLLHPTSARARLWEDSAAWLAEGVLASRRVARRPGKHECRLRGPETREPRPLLAVLLLDRVERSEAARQVAQIVQHQVRFNPADPEGPARQLAMAADLVGRVPVRSLCLPRDLARLPEVARDLERLVA